MAAALQKTYILLGGLATVSALALASFASDLPPVGVKILSFIPAVCLGLIAAFDVGSKANAARAAWRLLKSAVLLYENDTTYTIKDLHKQYVAGEALLGDIRFNTSVAKPGAPKR
jgi:hypothetical protein